MEEVIVNMYFKKPQREIEELAEYVPGTWSRSSYWGVIFDSLLLKFHISKYLFNLHLPGGKLIKITLILKRITKFKYASFCDCNSKENFSTHWA